MAGPGNVLIKIGADASQAVRELGKVDKSLDSTASTHSKMSAGLKKAALPAAAALGAIGFAAIDATKAAAEDAAAQEKLAGVLERTAGATAAQIKQTEDWISKTSLATGVADDDLRPAMENLVTATGSVSQSQKEMQAALDISAASGKDLETVTKAMALAHSGQTAKLAKLVPGLSEAARESKNMDVIMGELADKTGGAMAKSTETAAGQFKIFQNQTAELQESLGAALLPVVEALAPLLNNLASMASKNTTAIKILVVVVAALAAGILAANVALKVYAGVQKIVTVATKAWAAAQWLINVALNANPIGLVVVALIALAAGIYLAYTRSATFRRIVGDAMDAVAGAIRALRTAFENMLAAAVRAFNWITAHWKLALFAFGPVGAAAYLIATNFDKIKNAATLAFDAIEAGIKAVIDPIKDLIRLLGKIHVPKIHLPGVPNPFSLSVPPAAGATGGVAGRSATPAGGVVINVYGAIDPEGTARTIRRSLRGLERRHGALGLSPWNAPA